MSLLRLLNVQGLLGIAASIAFAVLLVIQIGEKRHWQKESGRFEQLYDQEQAALAGTVAHYRAAAAQAHAADKTNAERVAAEQRTISERTSNDFETRLAAARSLARRLRQQTATAAADPGSSGAAPMSGLSASSGGSDEGTGEDRLSQSDALLATEQGIQLDELIKWIRAQSAIDPNKNEN